MKKYLIPFIALLTFLIFCGEKTTDIFYMIDNLDSITKPNLDQFLKYIQSGPVASRNLEIEIRGGKEKPYFSFSHNTNNYGEMFLAVIETGTLIEFDFKIDTVFSDPGNMAGIIVQDFDDHKKNAFFCFIYRTLMQKKNSYISVAEKDEEGTIIGFEPENSDIPVKKWVHAKLQTGSSGIELFINNSNKPAAEYKFSGPVKRAYFGFHSKNSQILVKDIISRGKKLDMEKYGEEIFKNKFHNYLNKNAVYDEENKSLPVYQFDVSAGVVMRALIAVTPSVYKFELKLNNNPEFQYSCGIPGIGRKLCGVGFTVKINEPVSGDSLVFYHEKHPLKNVNDRLWSNHTQDLGKFKNKTVTVTMRTEPKTTDPKTQKANFNLAFWGEPIITDNK